MTAPLPEDELYAQAEAWFVRLRADDASARDRDRFAAWLAQGAEHVRAWEETCRLFVLTEHPARDVHRHLHPAARTSRRRPLAWAAVCASLALAVWGGAARLDDLLADATTALGERRALPLADGSVVEMNTGSALDIRLEDGERRVRLRHGEAFFQVARDADRPFVVQTDHGAVRVTGTRFSVADRDGETVVAVEEGSVEVRAARGDGGAVRLTHDQQTAFDRHQVAPVRGADAAAAFAWRRGQVVFRQQSLGAVVAELNRYWPGRVVVADKALAERPLSGVFDVDRREASLAALAALLDVQVTRVTPYLIILH